MFVRAIALHQEGAEQTVLAAVELDLDPQQALTGEVVAEGQVAWLDQ